VKGQPQISCRIHGWKIKHNKHQKNTPSQFEIKEMGRKEKLRPLPEHPASAGKSGSSLFALDAEKRGKERPDST